MPAAKKKVQKTRKETYTPKDVMEITGISQATVYNLFCSRDKGFPSYKFSGRWLIDIKAYEKWTEEQTSKSYINYMRQSARRVKPC